MPTRRQMLKVAINSSALVALSRTVPAFLAQSARAAVPGRDGRVLVVIQLEGGNDAINTLVPFADEGYARNRKVLRIPEKGLIRVDDRVGLHPALRGMGNLLDRGDLALVPGVGYPNPSRSHFQSMAIWQTARLDPEESNGPGWIGRSLDDQLGATANPNQTGGASLFVGDDTPPTALRGRRYRGNVAGTDRGFDFASGVCTVVGPNFLALGQASADRLEAFVRRSMLDAYASADRVAELTRGRVAGADVSYPNTTLAGRLKTVSQLLKAELPARVFIPSNPATTRTPASRIRISGCSASSQERSRLSWMI